MVASKEIGAKVLIVAASTSSVGCCNSCIWVYFSISRSLSRLSRWKWMKKLFVDIFFFIFSIFSQRRRGLGLGGKCGLIYNPHRSGPPGTLPMSECPTDRDHKRMVRQTKPNHYSHMQIFKLVQTHFFWVRCFGASKSPTILRAQNQQISLRKGFVAPYECATMKQMVAPPSKYPPSHKFWSWEREEIEQNLIVNISHVQASCKESPESCLKKCSALVSSPRGGHLTYDLSTSVPTLISQFQNTHTPPLGCH